MGRTMTPEPLAHLIDAHREEHHHEYADYIGEFYCDQLPDGSVCSECLDVDDNHIDWPCPTIRALDGK